MLSEVLDGLVKLLGPIATLSKDRRELKDTALRSISTALDETYLYYRDLESNITNRNDDREEVLSKYWSAAAVSLRHFDSELAVLCDYKSEFWVNPNNFDESRIQELGIKLGDVREAYRKMLSPNNKFTLSSRKK